MTLTGQIIDAHPEVGGDLDQDRAGDDLRIATVRDEAVEQRVISAAQVARRLWVREHSRVTVRPQEARGPQAAESHQAVDTCRSCSGYGDRPESNRLNSDHRLRGTPRAARRGERSVVSTL